MTLAGASDDLPLTEGCPRPLQTRSEAETSRPEAEISRPETVTSRQEADTSQTEAEKSRPAAGLSRPEAGSSVHEDELQHLGTEAIEQLASGLNKAAITIQELGQNVRKKFRK